MDLFPRARIFDRFSTNPSCLGGVARLRTVRLTRPRPEHPVGDADLSFILHLFAIGLRIEGWVRPFLGLCWVHGVERRVQERRWTLRKRAITSGANRIHQGP